MIGQRIESRPGFPYGAVLWLMIAVAFLVLAGVFRSPHPAIFAALPLLIGLSLLLVRERPFDAQITAEGVEVQEPPLSLPYSDIEAVLMPGKPGRAQAPIQLVHADGVVRFPPRLNVRSDELFAFLIDQLPAVRPRDLPVELAKYCSDKEAIFGPGLVFAFRARPHRAVRRRRVAIAVSVACALAGLIWLVAGILLPWEGEVWIGFGILGAFLSGLFALAFRFGTTGPRVKNWRQSGLVITPAGLAMVQGDMRGEMAWDELRDIRFGVRPGFFEIRFSNASARGIHLIVAGATITITDLYDRPLGLIYQRLRTFWKGDHP